MLSYVKSPINLRYFSHKKLLMTIWTTLHSVHWPSFAKQLITTLQQEVPGATLCSQHASSVLSNRYCLLIFGLFVFWTATLSVEQTSISYVSLQNSAKSSGFGKNQPRFQALVSCLWTNNLTMSEDLSINIPERSKQNCGDCQYARHKNNPKYIE